MGVGTGSGFGLLATMVFWPGMVVNPTGFCDLQLTDSSIAAAPRAVALINVIRFIISSF
jgi:hypothetical protein